MGSFAGLVIGLCMGVLLGVGVTYARSRRSGQPAPNDARLREVQLDLDAAGERIKDLEHALGRERTQQSETRSSGRDDLLDDLANSLSQPVAFLAVQVAHATNGTSADLTVTDMALTGTRILQALQTFEIFVQGVPGEPTLFDPDLHTAATGNIEPEMPVVVLVPAIAGKSGRLVRRAVVEPR